MNWNTVVDEYLDSCPEVGASLKASLEALGERGPAGITVALDPDEADTAKSESAAFVLHAIKHALNDQVLTSEEVDELKVLQRILRIEEGDLLRLQRSKVTDVLCQEAGLMFEDQGISPAEEVKKARLQEVLGLGYDDFMSLLAPEIEQLHRDLMDRLQTGDPQTWLGTEWQEVRDRLRALALTQFVQWVREAGVSTAGYIYLLTNPSMPGMVKLGRTAHPPSKRAGELASATGVPTPFEVVFEVLVADQVAAEAYVHRVLEERGCRVSDNREFFAVTPAEAIQVMLEAHQLT